MHYFCYSCQTQTDVLTLPQPTCGRCYSDFVEEIESGPVHGEQEWSDEDATLTSIWNTVFRDTLIGNDPLIETESEDEYHYAYNFGNDYTTETAQEEYAANEDTAGWITEEEEEEEDTEPEFDTHSEWDAAHNTVSDSESLEDSASEYATDYIPSSGDDDEDEYSSFNSDQYHVGDASGYQYYTSEEEEEVEEEEDDTGHDNYDDEEEEEEDQEEDQEEDDMIGLGELLRQTHIDVDDSEEFGYGGLPTEVPDFVGYNGLSLRNDYADESDYNYFFRNLQEEAAFVDAENWDTFPATAGAPDSVIDTLPRHRLRTGDAALHKDCSICLNAFGVNVELINLPCMHGFHSACIEQWLQLNASCPVCRCPCF